MINRHGHRLGDDLPGEQRRILRGLVLLPHRRPGRACRDLRSLPAPAHRLQLLPQPALSQVPGLRLRKWMADRAEELLPVEYFHVVFTLPDTFNALALANKRVVYGVLFDAVAQTLLEVAANPKHLGAKIGFLAILHTWGQNLCLHPHVHCVVPGGGLSPDGSRWIACSAGFFLPVRVLSKVFRGKFIDLLKQARCQASLCMESMMTPRCTRLIDASVQHDWVVYAKPPFGGPEQVLKYLARYTHRIAISNRRLVSMDDQQRHLPLEGLRPRQPPTHDDAGRRRVPAPLPAARRPAAASCASATSDCWPTACEASTWHAVAGCLQRQPPNIHATHSTPTPPTITTAARSAAKGG